MDPRLAASYAHCRESHRRHGRTYYLATRLLPVWKRRHVHALYGFTRYADEIVDQTEALAPEERAARLTDPAEFPGWVAVVTHWREGLHAVASEVKAGVASVTFADEKGLQYCEVLPLLRLPERRRLRAAAAEQVAGAEADSGAIVH